MKTAEDPRKVRKSEGKARPLAGQKSMGLLLLLLLQQFQLSPRIRTSQPVLMATNGRRRRNYLDCFSTWLRSLSAGQYR